MTSRPWKTNERRLVAENFYDRGADWCAAQLGRTPNAVTLYCRKHGIKGKRGRRPRE